ncbi:MAG: DUF1631 domain-containing protein [Pseudomonadales bacterium]
MSQTKVVPLHVAEPSRTRIPPILNSVRQQSKRRLSELLGSLFDLTDDALFELADRSGSDAGQHMYFDAMRQLRLNRAEIIARFFSALYAGFDAIFSSPPSEGGEHTADQFGLVDNDSLEVSVAIAGISSKITSRFSLEIMELTKRIDHLCQVREVNERTNPLGPQQLSESFAHAIDEVDVDIRVRIILLKLFERLVMERIDPLYADANRMLADAGVLTDLRKTLRRGRSQGHPAQRAARRDGSGGAGGQGNATGAQSPAGTANEHSGTHGSEWSGAGADAPQPTAAGARSGSQPGAGQSAGGGAAGFAGTDFGVIQRLLERVRGTDIVPPDPSSVLTTPTLLQVLSSVQSEVEQEPITIEEVPPLLDVRHLVVARAPDVTGHAIANLGRADEDVVNFIGMLFDYILNDRNLAIPMKALIARLQIPIIKLAIIDKGFFNQPSHPARQLLNELSSAGIGWSSAAELKRDALYNKIESVVLRVLNGFRGDVSLFEQLVIELRQFVKHDHQRNARIEKRVRQAAEGKALTSAAKQTVQKLINQKACGLRLPHEVGRFISEIWSKVLVYACVKHGERSEQWQRSVQSLDELLWSLQPLASLEEVERRDALLEPLIESLDTGMAGIEIPDNERSAARATLREQLEEIGRNDRAYLEEDAVPQIDSSFEALAEVVLLAPDEVDQPDDQPAQPEFVARIKALQEGVWVELTEPDGTLLRCKLSAIVKPGERYVFVNRRGMKVAERSRMQLACELQEGRLTLLKDAEVFDRALEAVIGNLRQLHENRPQPSSH